MRIRAASRTDVPAVLELARRFLRESPYGAIFGVHPAGLDWIAARCLEIGVILVAERDGGLVGMLAAMALPHPISDEWIAEELAWWVEPEHRRGTLGPKLLEALETWALQNACVAVKMVAPVESAVGGFYLRRGYVAVETSYLKRIA